MPLPGNKLMMRLSAKEITDSVDSLKTRTTKVYDAVAAALDSPTPETVIEPLRLLDASYSIERNSIDFPQHVSADKAVRDASNEADKVLSEFDVEMTMRKDVHDVLEKFQAGEHFAKLSAEGQRLIERLVKVGRRNGLHLDEATRDWIATTKKEMSRLGIDFEHNLSEEDPSVEFTEEELVGVPADFIKSLDTSASGKKIVTLKYPHYFPCMKLARNPATRRILETKFNQRGLPKNAEILEKLVKLREEKAAKLGYATHSDYVLEMRMAKDAATVAKFLSELAVKLQPSHKKEMEKFLSLKAEECSKWGFPNDNKINMWDIRYYMNLVEERDYTVDSQQLKEYFPMEHVTTGMFKIYETLLGLIFEKCDNTAEEVWHEDVSVYRVKDSTSSNLIGYFYLDLYPRDGKFTHAACFPLQPGCLVEDGKRQLPVAAMVANFTKPVGDQPALLLHDEVETYFHEFGHVMHHICSEAEYAYFSGTAVERDFVEAPSQMLENWCWTEESLRMMSKHYKDGSAIPADLLQSLIKSRKANAGLFNLRQIMLAQLDQRLHTGQHSGNLQSLYAELAKQYMGVEATPETNMPASFGHLAGGYDAQYYGYMWSEVFCHDMFASQFRKHGVMSAEIGRKYREKILKPGGSRDAADMLRDFLGREPQQEAFLEAKGLV